MNWTPFSTALLAHLFFQTHVLAQESTTLGIHTFSYHNSGNYNDTTPGLYLERNQFVIGAYHNSIRNTSVYAGYTWGWELPRNPVFQAISLTGGLATGYRHKGYDRDLSVLAATSLRHDLDNRKALRLSLLPLHKRSPANYVLHLSYEIKMKH
jgi:hypothetical protein